MSAGARILTLVVVCGSAGGVLADSDRVSSGDTAGGDTTRGDTTGWTWQLPPGFPEPHVPPENPMSATKVELGRRLFYDRRLSGNGAASCASCHQQARAFSDGRARAVGATGALHPRSAMSLANVAYAPTLGWHDAATTALEDQAAIPMFNRDPVELGLTGAGERATHRLREVPRYRALFAAAFPDDPDPIHLLNARRAIAAFERTLLSGDSPYDRLVYRDDREAMTATARAGMRLFFSERVGCSQCHAGVAFAGPIAHAGEPAPPDGFRDNGLGRFRVPTLRNVAVTAPYMHDGRFATLDDVLDHYARGPRPQGVGANPDGAALRAFALGRDERRALLAFLDSLTDEAFLRDPRFSDPAAEAPPQRHRSY